MKEKPLLSLAQIINMSVGFMGIQCGFALQNGNASRILQNYGAHVEDLSWFWLVAPLTGMIVQPIIGYYSDTTWGRLGRRRPYFLAGAIIACIALCLMPNAGMFTLVLSPLIVGASFLMLMDISFNISMEPFRALVADNLPSRQRTLGFATQTVLIGLGAIVGSWLPFVLSDMLDLGATTEGQSKIPLNVTYSFYIGAGFFLLTILWTVLTTKEFPPKEYAEYHPQAEYNYGEIKGIGRIVTDFARMPKAMRQLGWVQFFSWFALFSMWVFTTPAVAHHLYGISLNDLNNMDTAAQEVKDTFSTSGDWVGFSFGIYNMVSAGFALFLPLIARRLGRRRTHAFSLICGGLGLISIYFLPDPALLWLPMIGIGIAWASILAMPYAILAGSIPSGKIGIYMGIFNFFITLPQIVSGFLGGLLVRYVYGGDAIWSIVGAGIFMFIAAAFTTQVEDKD